MERGGLNSHEFSYAVRFNVFTAMMAWKGAEFSRIQLRGAFQCVHGDDGVERGGPNSHEFSYAVRFNVFTAMMAWKGGG